MITIKILNIHWYTISQEVGTFSVLPGMFFFSVFFLLKYSWFTVLWLPGIFESYLLSFLSTF